MNLPSNPSREKIDGMEQLEELVQSLQRKEDECQRLGLNSRDDEERARLFGKADGIRIAYEDLQALIRWMSGPSDLKLLEGEDIRVCPVDGCILPSEIHRIKLKYGVQLSGAYNFAQTRELRLANGAKLVF